MSEYFFIRQRGEGSPKVGIPEDFVNRVEGHFKQTGAPYLQELKNANHEIFIDHEKCTSRRRRCRSRPAR